VVKGSANTRFLYDGDALVAEYNSAGAMTDRYVHGPNAAADDPLVHYAGAGIGTPPIANLPGQANVRECWNGAVRARV
jgi:hypothetical protein